MSYLLKVEVPPKEELSEFQCLKSLSVGAACFYLTKKQNCAICRTAIKSGSLVFTHVYDTTECTMYFSGYFDLDCFFEVFRMKGYLQLDGFHDLRMSDRVTIEGRITEGNELVRLKYQQHARLFSEVKKVLSDLSDEELRSLVDSNLTGSLPDIENEMGVFLTLAADMTCFGAIVNNCEQCKSQLIPSHTEYSCSRNNVQDNPHTSPFKTRFVSRKQLTVPKDLQRCKVVKQLMIKGGLGNPVDRLLIGDDWHLCDRMQFPS